MYKQYKLYSKIILLTLPLLIGFYLFLYLFLYYHSNRFFIEDKVAKSIHLQYHANQDKKPFDYIFIGSSKTQNHISTNLFKKHGLRVYNYGRPSMYLVDFPFAVQQALKQKPRHIVLSIDIEKLLSKDHNIKEVKFPTQIDYAMINKINQNYTLQFNSFQEYLSNVIRLKDLWFRYKRLQRNAQLLDQRLKEYDIDEHYIDCNISSFRGRIARSVFVCSNGDGFILSKNFKGYASKRVKIEVKEWDSVYYRLLHALILHIKESNVVPIIVFEVQRYATTYQFDREFLNKLKIDNVIVLVNYLNTNRAYWADQYHYNYIGRYHYTKKLIDELKKLRK